jgi:hypothetical protein
VSARGGLLGVADYAHPIFDPYRNARGGDYGAVRIYRYRRLTPPDSAQILAWTDDGAPMLVESRLGSGRVLLWASDLGNVWNDLAVRAVFLPTVHQSVRYLSRHREAPVSYAVGQAVEPVDMGDAAVEMVIESPDGSRTSIAPGDRGPLPLAQAGVYTLRPMAGGVGLPFAANLDPAESDLAQLDRPAFVAAVSSTPGGEGEDGVRGLDLSAEERERRQRLWWYAAVAALAILVTESVVAGVRPRGMGA